MTIKSRRNFIKSFTYSAITSIASLFSPFYFGKKLNAGSVSKKNISKNKVKEFMKSTRKLDTDFIPGYLKLHHRGELKKRGEELWQIMEKCKLCPRMCEVNKLKGEKGFCDANSQLEISSYHPHFGEERPLVGNGGSGTIFLTNCSLR